MAEEKLEQLSQLATWCRSRGALLSMCWTQERWRVGIRKRGTTHHVFTYGPKKDNSPEALIFLLDQAIGEYNKAHGGP